MTEIGEGGGVINGCFDMEAGKTYIRIKARASDSWGSNVNTASWKTRCYVGKKTVLNKMGEPVSL